MASKVTPDQMHHVNQKINAFTAMNTEFSDLLRTVREYVKKQQIKMPPSYNPHVSWGYADGGCSETLDNIAHCSVSFNFQVKLPKEITTKFTAFEKEKLRRASVAERIRERIIFSDSVYLLAILKDLK